MKNLGFNVFGREAMEEFLEKHNLQDLQQAIAEQKEMDTIKQKAIADGTFMKAPNGKPTNLNEKQWLQVRTTNFKNWFGDWENNPKDASKVVDENGEPLVVYHGSEERFKIFKADAKRKHDLGLFGKGFYFTSNKKLAKAYGNNKELYEVFLNIRTPYNAQEDFLGLFNNFNSEKELKDYFRSEGFSEKELNNVDFGNYDNADGVITLGEQDEIVVKNPNQIKSATDNNGNFSLTDDNIQAAWGKKRELYNSDLLKSEISAIQKYIETLPNNTDTSRGLWHVVKYNRGANKGKTFAYKFNTSLHQYEQNRKDKHDGFEIVDKREVSSLTEEQLNRVEYVIRNRGNIDSVLSKQGTWIEERSLYDSDVIVNNRQAERNNDRLDSKALQGEANRGQSDRDSRSNQGTDEIETFTTPQGELYGFVDKEGNIYLDETKITPEHPIHEYTHLWDRALQQRNPELWNRGVELLKLGIN